VYQLSAKLLQIHHKSTNNEPGSEIHISRHDFIFCAVSGAGTVFMRKIQAIEFAVISL
jgi:hypothetical protein